jgi:NTE family protein
MLTKKIDYNNFTLVLSGGGALGLAHLGVIEDLEKEDIFPKEIVGTSMGAIIGACLAIRYKERDIFDLFKEFAHVSEWVQFSFSGNSIITNKKINKIFSNVFGDKKIKDTHIPLKIIATDIRTGDIKVFTQEDDVLLKDAVMASMAIPGIFEEQTIGNNTYVDGFLCENLGINQASLDNILAIDVLGVNSFLDELPDNFLKTNNVLGMFEKSMRLLIYNQTKTNIKNSKKKIYLIEPMTNSFKTFQFNKYKEIKALGSAKFIRA